MVERLVERRAILVPLFLAAQGLLAWSAAHRETPPAFPDLERLPANAEGWRFTGSDQLTPDVLASLGPDRVLDRNYVYTPSALIGNLFISWYRSQLAGNRQPHSPQMCLPGSGWMPVRTGEVTLQTAAGPIRVNRWLVVNGAQRAAVLYWYQKPRRVVAGEWAAKLWLGVDALRDHRTDLAFVRVVVWSPSRQGDADDDTLAAGAQFARAVYPQLRDVLPR